MAAGGPGDHPLTDIIQWGQSVYGDAADNLIRKIAALSSRQELEEWWDREIGWSARPELAAQKAAVQVEKLVQRARQSGWELSEQNAP